MRWTSDASGAAFRGRGAEAARARPAAGRHDISPLAATVLRGLDNNVYTEIGLVLLVAPVCKNAILIVEFAEQLRRRGPTVMEATAEASGLRFRPILTTALSFVLGTAPLLFATGAGANSGRSIGTAVFGYMALAPLVGAVFIPALYGLSQRIVPGHAAADAGDRDAGRDDPEPSPHRE